MLTTSHQRPRRLANPLDHDSNPRPDLDRPRLLPRRMRLRRLQRRARRLPHLRKRLHNRPLGRGTHRGSADLPPLLRAQRRGLRPNRHRGLQRALASPAGIQRPHSSRRRNSRHGRVPHARHVAEFQRRSDGAQGGEVEGQAGACAGSRSEGEDVGDSGHGWDREEYGEEV